MSESAAPRDTASSGADGRIYWSRRHRVFFAKYKVGDQWKTKTLPVTCDTEEKARDWFRSWRGTRDRAGVDPLNQDVVVDNRKTIRKLSSAWLDWKRSQPGVDRRDMRMSSGLVKKWTLPHPIADLDLENELTLGHCTEWVEWVMRSGRAPYTVRNVVSALRGFLVDARGKGWVQMRENPLLDPYIKRLVGGAEQVAGRNTIIHLKRDDVAKLLSCASAKIPNVRRVRNLFAVATGCRAAEILGVCWDDIRLDDPIPTVRVFRQLRVGGSRAEAMFKDPKRKSHRVLPLHPALVETLRAWKDEGWRQHVGVPPRSDDPVFPNERGHYAFGRCPDSFRSDLKAAGLPILFDRKHKFTFHACRRTFMSLLEEVSVPREIIGALAGHAGGTVTDRHYIAKNLERFAEAVGRLDLKPVPLDGLPDGRPKPHHARTGQVHRGERRVSRRARRPHVRSDRQPPLP